MDFKIGDILYFSKFEFLESPKIELGEIEISFVFYDNNNKPIAFKTRDFSPFSDDKNSFLLEEINILNEEGDISYLISTSKISRTKILHKKIAKELAKMNIILKRHKKALSYIEPFLILRKFKEEFDINTLKELLPPSPLYLRGYNVTLDPPDSDGYIPFGEFLFRILLVLKYQIVRIENNKKELGIIDTHIEEGF